MAELRRTAIRQSLNRPDLLIGGERELVLSSGLLSFTLIFVGVSLLTTVVAVALWTTALYILRRMAKVDPQLSRVYVRHLRYSKYYPASSTPYRINPTQKIPKGFS